MVKYLKKKNQFRYWKFLIGNKLVDTVVKLYDGITTKVSRRSPRNNAETITNEHDKEIHKGRYISPEERQKMIDDLRLI